MMETVDFTDNVLLRIREVADDVLPKDARLILFGSRARGNAKADSDWDLLVLLDKERITTEDHDSYTYPFWELGWRIGAMIHPVIYTQEHWKYHNNPIFRTNVETEGIRIC